MAAGPDGDLWVFGYGSLMWRPGFPHVEASRARVSGMSRSLCIYSVHWRGTPRRPGLVLGLDRGGACEGIAFRVGAGDAADVRRALAERELIYGVYREQLLPVRLAGGRAAMALAYVAERRHPSYAGDLTAAAAARIVRAAAGEGGTNIDYLANTLASLGQLSIREPALERIARMASPFAMIGPAREGKRARAIVLARLAERTPSPAPPLRPGPERFAFRRRLGWLAWPPG